MEFKMLFISAILFALTLLYLRVATKLNIVDKPNDRSSHRELTIRGGGIIYLFAAIILIFLNPHFWVPLLCILIVGVISFIDDRISLSTKIRAVVHLVAVTILFLFLGIHVLLPWWAIIASYIIVIGILNAYNFMDGINGITGAYTLVVLSGLQYINLTQKAFIDADMIWFPIVSTLVFLYFNFRKKAKCFAGDVGSVSIAFWIILLLSILIIDTRNFSYILFLAVYGVDAILTIIHRIILKQNIFEAHRLHLYQILANERKMPHLVVSSIYAIIQALIIYVVIKTSLDIFFLFGIIVVPLVIIYLTIKPRVMIKNTYSA